MIADNTDRASALVAAAIESWPGLAPSQSSLIELTRGALEGSDDPEGLRPDLVLARALARSDASALAVFESEFIPGLAGALRRAGLAKDVIDDALQIVRFRLLVRTDSRPARISSYRGRSSLRRWLHVVAIREAGSLVRRARTRATSELELAEQALARAGDLETEFHAREHRQALTRALTTAFGELSAKQRLLLRLDVLDGLSDAEIATIYGVHRTTALRWVQRAMTDLISATKTHLARGLAVDESELDSLVRGLLSHLDLSLARILVETPAPTADSPEEARRHDA